MDSRTHTTKTVLSLAAVLGGVYGLTYLLYAPARVADAIDRSSRAAGLTATYSMALPSGPGAAPIRNLTLSAAPHTWSLHIAAVDVNLTPVLGGPRQIRLELREQPVRLHRSELEWESTLSAQLQLAGLRTDSLKALRAVEIAGRDGVLRVGAHAAREVAMTMTLTRAKAGELSGAIAVRGVADPQVLQLLGLRPEIRALVQGELEAPFALESRLTLSAAGIRLDDLSGSWGETSFEGRLAWVADRAEATLLVTTPTHRLDVSMRGEEAVVGPAALGREASLTRVSPFFGGPRLSGTFQGVPRALKGEPPFLPRAERPEKRRPARSSVEKGRNSSLIRPGLELQAPLPPGLDGSS